MRATITFLVLMACLLASGCSAKSNEGVSNSDKLVQKNTPATKAKVTFIELGSVSCIPCKAMQPVMKAIEAEFGDQIQIIFYDVWQDPTPAQQYAIRVIPTQVFLAENGKEFHRHEGFYPQAEIEKILLAKGLQIMNPSGQAHD